MEIHSADFLCSNSDWKKCPDLHLPEYAFIGRSNVGKSSLINSLTNNKKLAKTSGKPGKTQLINHFKINNSFYLLIYLDMATLKFLKKQELHFKNLHLDI